MNFIPNNDSKRLNFLILVKEIFVDRRRLKIIHSIFCLKNVFIFLKFNLCISHFSEGVANIKHLKVCRY